MIMKSNENFQYWNLSKLYKLLNYTATWHLKKGTTGLETAGNQKE